MLKKKMVAVLLLPSMFLGVNTIGQDPAEVASRGTTISSSSNKADKVIAAGKKYMGTPYKFGSDRSTTTTFDCSDFVRQAYKEGAGIILPGNSRAQAAYVEKIGKTTTN